MKYFKVTAPECEPAFFAVSEKTGKVFGYSDFMGGAFLHYKNAEEIKSHLNDPDFTVKKDHGTIFKNLSAWWSLEEAKMFIECLIEEKEAKK